MRVLSDEGQYLDMSVERESPAIDCWQELSCFSDGRGHDHHPLADNTQQVLRGIVMRRINTARTPSHPSPGPEAPALKQVL